MDFIDLSLIKKTFLFICMLCSRGYTQDKTQQDVYPRLVQQITSECFRDFHRKWHLTVGGSGGCLSHDVEEITLYLDGPVPVTVEEARRLIVLSMEHVRYKLDNCTAILPYLREYPTPPQCAHCVFGFPEDARLVDCISFVMHAHGKLHYLRHSDKEPAPPTFLEEPYEDALAIVKAKYPEEFPEATTQLPEAYVVEKFTDTRDLPFDIQPGTKAAAINADFP